MLYLVPLPPYHVVQRNSITELMLISRQREWQVSKQKKWRRRGKFSLISISKAVSFWMLHHQLCPSWAVYTWVVQLWDILLGFIWPRSSIWSYVSKGQLISKWNFGVFKSSKMLTLFWQISALAYPNQKNKDTVSSYRHSSISAVSISAIFVLMWFIILSSFPPL